MHVGIHGSESEKRAKGTGDDARQSDNNAFTQTPNPAADFHDGAHIISHALPLHVEQRTTTTRRRQEGVLHLVIKYTGTQESRCLTKIICL